MYTKRFVKKEGPLLKIERNLFVLADQTGVEPPVDYVQGTNAIPITFYFRDYTIPEGAGVKVYIRRPSGKAEYDQIPYVGENTVNIDVKDSMFSEVGRSYIQIQIEKEEKTLVTFEYPVDVKRNHVAGEVPGSSNSSNFLDEYLGKIDERMDHVEDLADQAQDAKDAAQESEKNAAESASAAEDSAKLSESWAVGGTGIRPGEDDNNSKYWSEQSRDYSASWKGSLLPKGTIPYEQLPVSGNIPGHMYNINNGFETDSRFKDGAGYSYPSGTNVYWTSDGKWDCLSGTLTKDVTLAEYDAMPREERMNGTTYYISDADNSFPDASPDGKGMMSAADKSKLDGIEAGAEINVQADWTENDSNSDAFIKNKPKVPKKTSDLINDSSFICGKQISQAEYDALSLGEKMNGTVYFINDED